MRFDYGVLAVLVALGGASTLAATGGPFLTGQETLEAGQPFPLDRAGQIQRDVTTVPELVELFGAPTRRARTLEGFSLVWEHEVQGFRMAAGGEGQWAQLATGPVGAALNSIRIDALLDRRLERTYYSSKRLIVGVRTNDSGVVTAHRWVVREVTGPQELEFDDVYWRENGRPPEGGGLFPDEASTIEFRRAQLDAELESAGVEDSAVRARMIEQTLKAEGWEE